jgi:FdhD protein
MDSTTAGPAHQAEASSVVPIVRVRDAGRLDMTDVAAAEVPLEIRVQGRAFAVVMRTPGSDRFLAAGFLLSERVVRHVDDIGLIEHCRDTTIDNAEPRRNVVSVTLVDAAGERVAAALANRRELMASSACGVCGRATIESLREGLTRMDDSLRVRSGVVAQLPSLLRGRQPIFSSTGGLHAAGVFAADGQLVAAAEDVGRHNAVDKVVGQLLLRDDLPCAAGVLCVSGRSSFEIVQKAWCAGIPVVVSVSAPSSLAIELASLANMTLIGFARDGGFNIYAGAQRVD